MTADLCNEIQRLAHDRLTAWEAAKAQQDSTACIAAIQAVQPVLQAFADRHQLDLAAATAPSLAHEVRVLARAVDWFMERAASLVETGTLARQGDLFFEDLGYLALHAT